MFVYKKNIILFIINFFYYFLNILTIYVKIINIKQLNNFN
jgi:hypothetical protein